MRGGQDPEKGEKARRRAKTNADGAQRTTRKALRSCFEIANNSNPLSKTASIAIFRGCLNRHGDHIPDELVRKRAIDGTLPDKPHIKEERLVDSTKFSSSTKQLEAYHKAMDEWRSNPKLETYEFDMPDAGHGWEKGGQGNRETAHKVQANFDKNGVMITMFPIF